MDQAIKSLKSKNITVLERTQAEYDKAIATSNLLFRFSRPDCVVRPETAAHVQEIIKQAQFASKFIKALYAKLGINGQLTTAYHPQAN
ncbi:hypothetical protein PHLGIDRAFT_115369, partial [Phlebiopsis gigantea 11061_1 CR5-6]